MFKTFDIVEKRKEQLDKEKFIDNIIDKSSSECPGAIISFILKMRSNNRNDFNDMYDDNFFTKSKKALVNIENLDKIYDNILSQVNNGNNICDILKSQIP